MPLSKEEIEAVKNAKMSAAGSLASLAENEFRAPEKRINNITEANKSTEPTTHDGNDQCVHIHAIELIDFIPSVFSGQSFFMVI